MAEGDGRRGQESRDFDRRRLTCGAGRRRKSSPTQFASRGRFVSDFCTPRHRWLDIAASCRGREPSWRGRRFAATRPPPGSIPGNRLAEPTPRHDDRKSQDITTQIQFSALLGIDFFEFPSAVEAVATERTRLALIDHVTSPTATATSGFARPKGPGFSQFGRTGRRGSSRR